MSPLDRLDPRTRLISALVFCAALVATPSLAGQAVGLGLALVGVIVARLPVCDVLRRMLHLEGAMLLVLVMLPFTVPGHVLTAPWGLEITEEGLRQAAGIALKANGTALALFALLGGLEAPALGRALARLGVSGRFVHLFLFTARYLSLFQEEYSRLRRAMRARAFRPTTGLHCWRSLGQLFGMLLVRSLERAERIDAAMRCRGFTGRLPSLHEDESRPGRADLGFGAASAACALLVLAVGPLWI